MINNHEYFEKTSPYSAIGVEIFFILSDLEVHPGRVGVAIAVPLRQNGLRLLPLVVHEQPSWALRNEPNEEYD
jgi:hypothetical protein